MLGTAALVKYSLLAFRCKCIESAMKAGTFPNESHAMLYAPEILLFLRIDQRGYGALKPCACRVPTVLVVYAIAQASSLVRLAGPAVAVL